MITLGAKFGGPELSGSAFKKAWQRVSISVGQLRDGKIEEWKGHVPAVNVIFYIPGSIMDHLDFRTITASRFSRKRKMLLVNVPVPHDIVNDYDKSLAFIFEGLHKSNAIASQIFSNKATEAFDFVKAEMIVDIIQKQLQSPGFCAGIDAKIVG